MWYPHTMNGGTIHDLDIDIAVTGSVGVVQVAGDLDVRTAPRLIAAVRDVAHETVKAIELDTTGVEFVDSAGIRALIVSRNEAAGRGVDLALGSTSPSMRRVLEVTGLTPILTP